MDETARINITWQNLAMEPGEPDWPFCRCLRCGLPGSAEVACRVRVHPVVYIARSGLCGECHGACEGNKRKENPGTQAETGDKSRKKAYQKSSGDVPVKKQIQKPSKTPTADQQKEELMSLKSEPVPDFQEIDNSEGGGRLEGTTDTSPWSPWMTPMPVEPLDDADVLGAHGALGGLDALANRF
jgi:hypothetical protein